MSANCNGNGIFSSISNVNEVSVLFNRSPIIATANQTRPQSIIITLSATPGQKSFPTESISTTTASVVTENTNQLNPSTITKTPVRLISLSTGFNLGQTDNTQTDLRPSTYKPQFVQSPSTSDAHTSSDSEPEKSIIARPSPFSLANLPNAEIKSVIFRLSTRLSTLSASNTSEASDQTLPLLVNTRSTENPNKREITTNPKFTQKTPTTTDTDASHIIIPTTYSPSKTLLASLLPKHAISKGETEIFHVHSGEENESIAKIKNLEEYSSTEKLVAILPKKIIIVNAGINKQNHQTKSLTIENPALDSLPATSEKSVKTLIRKTPIISETSLPTYRERNSAERKIISKIHIRYTNPEKINNLASTPSTVDSSVSSEDYSSSQETSSEFSKPYLNFFNNQKPINAHYITTDLTTSQRPLTLSPTISSERKVTSPRTTTSDDILIDNLNSESESKRFHSKISFESESTTERGNSIKYTPPTTATINYKLESEKPSIFSFNSFPSSTTTQQTLIQNLNHHNIYTTQTSHDQRVRNRSRVKYSFEPNSATEKNYAELSSTTETASRFSSVWNNRNNNQSPENSNKNIGRKPIFKFTYNPEPTSTTSTERIQFLPSSSTTEKHILPNFNFNSRNDTTSSNNRFSYYSNPTSTDEISLKFSTSTTEQPDYVENDRNSNRHFYSKYNNNKPISSTEQVSSSTEKLEITSSQYEDVRSTTTRAGSSFVNSGFKTKLAEKIKLESVSEEVDVMVPDRVTDKYRFIETSDRNLNADNENVRTKTELFENRNTKPFRATAELPSVSEILATEDERTKTKPVGDSAPTFKPKPIVLSTDLRSNPTVKNRTMTVTAAADLSRNVTIPARLSRVNTAIKSLTAFGGTRRNSQTSKCNENQSTPDTKCNEILKQRYLSSISTLHIRKYTILPTSTYCILQYVIYCAWYPQTLQRSYIIFYVHHYFLWF